MRAWALVLFIPVLAVTVPDSACSGQFGPYVEGAEAGGLIRHNKIYIHGLAIASRNYKYTICRTEQTPTTTVSVTLRTS